MIRVQTSSRTVVSVVKTLLFRSHDCYGPYRGGVYYIYRKDRLPIDGILSKLHQPWQ